MIEEPGPRHLVRKIDGRRIGTAKEGPVTKQLRELYAAYVRGERDRNGDWLTKV